MAGRKARSAFFAPEVPAIHVLLSGMMSGGFIYIMSNRRNGTLYVGVTSDLVRRCYEHRNSLPRGFTKQYGLKKLVYLNGTMIRAVIQREKAIKHWSRAWKVRLIHAQNPDWRDLFEALI